MRHHTSDELEEVNRILKDAEPTMRQMDESTAAAESRWRREIATLERRVETECVDVDLGNGDTIAVRACLSNAESRRIADLERERSTLSDGDRDRADEIAFEILGILTANPLLTAGWFRQNPDRYAVSDMVAITLGGYEARIVRQGRRVQEAHSFRRE